MADQVRYKIKAGFSMNFFFYRILYKTLRLLLSFINFIAPHLLPKKICEIIADRKFLKLIWRDKPQAKPIWFHCASGEIEYIKPLLRIIREKHPKKSLFLTYYSPSGKPMAEKALFQSLEADGMAPLPWDEPHDIQKFLSELNPQCLIISRTDLWPELLRQCKKKNIPTILVAATFAPGSKKMSVLGKLFLGLTLPLLNKICVVSEDDKKMIKNIFPELTFTVTGDPRFDQVAYRIQNQRRDLPQNVVDWATNPIWIAGSTWPEDEVVLIPAIKELNFKKCKAKLILVPHETDTEHLQTLRSLLNKANIKNELFSETGTNETNHKINSDTQVLIFDQKGYLLDLYRLANFAFIGGSFKQQVHSVMEALGQGCLVLVGPQHLNNREAIEFQSIEINTTPLVRRVQNTADLANTAETLLEQSENYTHFTDSISPSHSTRSPDRKVLVQEKFNLKTKATEKTYQEILDFIK
jgi:3-deoxy-D-manno-octulosonic-acid transferase